MHTLTVKTKGQEQRHNRTGIFIRLICGCRTWVNVQEDGPRPTPANLPPAARRSGIHRQWVFRGSRYQ